MYEKKKAISSNTWVLIPASRIVRSKSSVMEATQLGGTLAWKLSKWTDTMTFLKLHLNGEACLCKPHCRLNHFRQLRL